MNFILFLKDLYFVSKWSLNIPEYRCLLIGHALQKISHLAGLLDLCTLLSLMYTVPYTVLYYIKGGELYIAGEWNKGNFNISLYPMGGRVGGWGELKLIKPSINQGV